MYAVRDRLALGACSLFGKNWFGSGSWFVLLFGVTYYCVCNLGPPGSGSRFLFETTYLSRLQSKPARLREPVLVIYAVRDSFALEAGLIFTKDSCYTALESILDPAYACFGIFRFGFRNEIYDT